MNEKIKKLAEQCASPEQFDVNTFAKLIIEEVMEILADSKNYNRCVHTNHDLDRAKCVVQEISKKIYESYL